MKSNEASTTSVGKAAERAAARFLEAKGFSIEARNVQTGRGEIDLIAWDAKTLVFVEVKARATLDFGGGQRAVDQRKRARLWRAGEAYLATRDGLWQEPPECRFDVVTVQIDEAREPSAWRCELHSDAFAG